MKKIAKEDDEAKKLELKTAALEMCRKTMVSAMRTGKLFVLNIADAHLVDFVNEFTSDETNFPTNLCFSR